MKVEENKYSQQLYSFVCLSTQKQDMITSFEAGKEVDIIFGYCCAHCLLGYCSQVLFTQPVNSECCHQMMNVGPAKFVQWFYVVLSSFSVLCSSMIMKSSFGFEVSLKLLQHQINIITVIIVEVFDGLLDIVVVWTISN